MKMTEIDTNSQGTRESRSLNISLRKSEMYFQKSTKKEKEEEENSMHSVSLLNL